MTMAYDNDLIDLSGSPAEVGRTFGRINSADIRAGMAQFHAEEPNRDALLATTDDYFKLVERYAPHWIEEAAALAAAAGVRWEDYLAYQGAKYRGINRPECYTYFAAPRHSADGTTLFHKNRDNKERPQAAYMKAIRVTGRTTYRFLATGDTSDIGTMMGVNEKGLAAAADTGGPDPHPRFRGMMNPDLMRLILEQGQCVDDALVMIEQFYREKMYAGGKIATNWMFADASGRARRVYQYHQQYEVIEDRHGLLTMREDDRGRTVLEGFASAPGQRVTPGLMQELSRTPPVLALSNISAMTASIPARRPELFTLAQFAVFNAGRTAYVPLAMGVTATPRVLVDGTLYRLSKRQPDGGGESIAQLEVRLETERGEMQRPMQALPENAAREQLTQLCLRQANAAAALLESQAMATAP